MSEKFVRKFREERENVTIEWKQNWSGEWILNENKKKIALHDLKIAMGIIYTRNFFGS